MITKISLKNVASYKDETILETDKPINLIYGLNGVGKTQFSKFLANSQDLNFQDCRIEGLNNEKVLVYNQDFVEKNFYNLKEQRGIFTLSSENVEIRKEIDILQEEMENLRRERENEVQNDEKKEKEIRDTRSEFQDSIWQAIKVHHYEQFKDFFRGCIGSKKDFSKFILDNYKFIPELENQNISIEEIKKQYEVLTDKTQTELDNLQPLSYGDFETIEYSPVFSEVIVGNQDSAISNLLQELQNGDWVKDGFDNYVREDFDICPFCQKETITKEFRNEIQKYFDKTYKDKIQEIKNLKNQYENLLLGISDIENFYRGDILNDNDLEFKKLYLDIRENICKNIQKIEEKIKEPSKKIELEKSKVFFEEFNGYICKVQAKVNSFNQKLADKNEEKEKLKEIFWNFVFSENQKSIQTYKKDDEKKDNERKRIQDNIRNLDLKINEKEGEIRTRQESSVNCFEAVEKINSYLKELGILSFYLKNQDKEGQEYCIVREGEDEPSFKTLSEGEKTLISFLYFLQLCQGREHIDEIDSEKIIVIDDPISSLSFNYVYDIAVLIKNIFFEESSPYKQLFILTHHLYFFHEFFKVKPKIKKRIKSFRLTRNENHCSCIAEIQEGEILNNYQAYWQILKDYKDYKAHKAIIPNAMRNILEHFLAFVCKESLSDIVDRYKDCDKRYSAFYRYINRESHSDSVNIVDTEEFDPHFFKAFEEIFNNLGFSEHYKKMMGEI